MAQKKGKTKDKDNQGMSPPSRPSNEPWLSQRTGRIIMIVASLALVAYMTYQLEPALGLGEAILWAIGFGLAIWGIFFLAYWFNRKFRG